MNRETQRQRIRCIGKLRDQPALIALSEPGEWASIRESLWRSAE